MKQLILIVTLLTVFNSRASAQESILDRKVRVDNKEGTIGSFLEEIGNKGDFIFSFNQEVPLDRIATVSASRQTVGQFMNDIFGEDVYCVEYGNKLHLKVANTFHGNYLVTGRVVESESGEPVPGANVIVLESDPLIGEVSDSNGYFEVLVPSDKPRIRISSIGYETTEISSNKSHQGDISLETKNQEIGEVTVVEYTTPTSKKLTIPTGIIPKSRLENQPVPGIEYLLQGNTSGIHVTNNSGMPGSSIQVKIRGTLSLICSDPAYYLDGIPIQGAIVNAISPEDIASVEIIKDASGSSIYGATAGNGVILLKSKQGKPGKTRFKINSYAGIQHLAKNIDLMNSYEFRGYYSLIGLGLDPYNMNSPHNTNWLDQTFHPGETGNIHFSVNGAREKTDYYFSLAAFDQAAIIRNLNLNRYTFNYNVGHSITPNWKIRHQVNYAYMDMKGLAEGSFLNDQNNPVLASITMYPTSPPIDSLLDYFSRYVWGLINGSNASYDVIYNESELSRLRRKNHVVNGKLSSTLKMSQNLELFTDIGYELYFQDNFSIHRGLINRGGLFGTKISETDYQVKDIGLDLNNFLHWKHSFNDIHLISAIAGFEISRSSNEWIPVNQDFEYPFLYEPIRYTNTSFASTQTLVGYNNIAGKASFNYSYNNRLFFRGSLRNDWVIFENQAVEEVIFSDLYPSLSAAWLFLDRSDRSENGWLRYGKLRYSWGMAGNSPRLDYTFHSRIFRDANYLYAFGSDRNIAYSASRRQFNEKFYWEKSTAHSIGIEMGLFQNRLYWSVDLFHNHQHKGELSDYNNPFNMIKDLYGRDYLGLAPLPPAEVLNRGIEWSIVYKSIEGNFRWDMNLHGTHMQNQILDIDPAYYDLINKGFTDPLTVNIPGETAGSFYGYNIERLFTEEDCSPDGSVRNQPQPYYVDEEGIRQYARAGDYKFEDVYPDGIIDGRDKTVLGDPYPDLIFGFNLNMQYKQVDLSMLWHGTWGNEIFNATKLWLYNPQGTSNWSIDMWNSYRSPVYDTEGNVVFPGFTDTNLHRFDPTSQNQNLRVSDFYIEDGSYLRLKQIQLGYTFSQVFSRRIHLEKLRIYLSATNLLTITNYSGLDPEVGGWGIDSGLYPQPRTFYFGFDIDF